MGDYKKLLPTEYSDDRIKAINEVQALARDSHKKRQGEVNSYLGGVKNSPCFIFADKYKQQVSLEAYK